MSLAATLSVIALLLTGADQALTPQTRPIEGAVNPLIPRDAGTEVAPATAGITLDAATRERPNEVVCRESARATSSRIGSNRRCRTRIEWARLEAESRRGHDAITHGGMGHHNRPSLTY